MWCLKVDELSWRHILETLILAHLQQVFIAVPAIVKASGNGAFEDTVIRLRDDFETVFQEREIEIKVWWIDSSDHPNALGRNTLAASSRIPPEAERRKDGERS